jgi:hypothetical protein
MKTLLIPDNYIGKSVYSLIDFIEANNPYTAEELELFAKAEELELFAKAED